MRVGDSQGVRGGAPLLACRGSSRACACQLCAAGWVLRWCGLEWPVIFVTNAPLPKVPNVGPRDRPCPVANAPSGTYVHCRPTAQLVGTFCHRGPKRRGKKGQASPMPSSTSTSTGTTISRLCSRSRGMVKGSAPGAASPRKSTLFMAWMLLARQESVRHSCSWAPHAHVRAEANAKRMHAHRVGAGAGEGDGGRGVHVLRGVHVHVNMRVVWGYRGTQRAILDQLSAGA